MRNPYRLAAVLLAAASLVPLAPPRPARAQEAQAGVEVQARGPVHEAFASLTGEAAPTRAVPKQPPAPIDELPPDEKPEGDAIWISGYWAYDDDREDFLWVSGLWRVVPPGKEWVAGYWRDGEKEWQWVPGFWASAAKEEEQQMTYLPQPPEAPKVAPPAKPPQEDSFYVPGIWAWNGTGYAWRAGYWARMQPGYVWIPDHYRWTPTGYVFVGGYWDLAVSKRGILYAPVVISPTVVRVGFTYTPAYAVRDTVIVDSLFVQPTTCHYYFGDYYEVKYRNRGYESCVVYSQRHYDSIIVYERYERRRDPTWINVQVNLYNDRCAGRAPVPPRVVNTTVVNQVNVTNVHNTTVVNNLTTVAPTKTVVQNKNINVVKLDNATRSQAKEQAQVVQSVAKQRSTNEVASGGGPPKQPKTAALSVPKAQPVKQGMVAPKRPAATQSARIERPTTPAANDTRALKQPATSNVNPLGKTNPVAPLAKQPATNVAPLTKQPAASASPAPKQTPAANDTRALKQPATSNVNPLGKSNPVAPLAKQPASNATPLAKQPAVTAPKTGVASPATTPDRKTPVNATPASATSNSKWLPAVPQNRAGQPLTQPPPGGARPAATQPAPKVAPKPAALQPKPAQQPARRPAPKDKDKDKDRGKR